MSKNENLPPRPHDLVHALDVDPRVEAPMILERRKFLTGLASLIAAPAIVRVSSLMPVRGIIQDIEPTLLMPADLYAELAAVTRRAFVPRLYVQLYKTNPLLALYGKQQ